MTLVVHGSIAARRALVIAMRLTSTAVGTRPFIGPEADVVKAMAEMVGHAHGSEEPADFSELVQAENPWVNPELALKQLALDLPDEESRSAAAHAAVMVTLFADEPDVEALHAARWVAQGLGADDQGIADVEQTAGEQAQLAQIDLFRRFLSWKTGVELEEVYDRLCRGKLVVDTPPEHVEALRRKLDNARESTLGFELARFYSDTDFALPGTPGMLPLEVLGSHDVHHLLTAYGASPEDEVYLAAFTAANTRSSGVEFLSVAMLQWHQGIKLGVFDPAHAVLNPSLLVRAAERGAETTTDLSGQDWDWQALLDQPLEEVRANLGVPEGGSIALGGRWDSKQSSAKT